ncbi:MFS transporter [Nonomuraea sp. PA05]|uniref:MFS transporter n=1 Tax=Nonomuraea sp. PA05 TaxID=2604466 RepID=UPI0011D65F9B|nr:MFS transporter [Nonomuraea sp. PA05]TYB61817.1 MFS transporter [Nonomuraea sp. PA05]
MSQGKSGLRGLRGFPEVMAAAGISTIGDGIQLVTLPLLAASLTTSPQAIAALAAAGMLPALIFALPAGALVDRIDRRRLLVIVDVVRALILAGLVLLLLSGRLVLWELFVITFVLGVCGVLFGTGSVAYLPSIVPKNKLAQANGYLSTITELGNGVIGPALGGPIFAISKSLPFAIDALSFAGSAYFLSRLARSSELAPAQTRAAPPAGSFGRQVAEGLGWLFRRRSLRSLVFVVAGWNLFGWMPEATFILYATQELQLGEVGYALLFTTTSVGAVLGGLVSSRLISRWGMQPVLYGSIGLYALLMVPVAFSDSVVVVGVAFFAQGIPLVAWTVVSTTIRQALVPDELLGRVASVFRLVASGFSPLGMLAGGLLAGWLGLRAVYLVSAAGIVLFVVMNMRGLRILAAEAETETRQAAHTEAP